MLFNEPKLLKSGDGLEYNRWLAGFSALQRAEIAEIVQSVRPVRVDREVSVLFNEPKLLKSQAGDRPLKPPLGFSALQRAEIAEI